MFKNPWLKHTNCVPSLLGRNSWLPFLWNVIQVLPIDADQNKIILTILNIYITIAQHAKINVPVLIEKYSRYNNHNNYTTSGFFFFSKQDNINHVNMISKSYLILYSLNKKKKTKKKYENYTEHWLIIMI